MVLECGRSFDELANLSDWQVKNILFHPRDKDGKLARPSLPHTYKKKPKAASLAEHITRAKDIVARFCVRRGPARKFYEQILDRWEATPAVREAYLRHLGFDDAKPERPAGKGKPKPRPRGRKPQR